MSFERGVPEVTKPSQKAEKAVKGHHSRQFLARALVPCMSKIRKIGKFKRLKTNI
jgi:hypothetical protein